MGLANGIGIGFPFFQGGVAREVTDYLARVAADSGSVDDVDALKDLVEFYKRQGTLDLTQLLAAPFLGSKVRTSTIYKYLSKLYSVQLAANDLTQTTELSQPYQSGNIAPNEVLSMSNPNGDSRYLTHPAISFAANQAWSVCVMINDNYKSGSIDFAGNSLGGLYTRISTGLKYSFINQSATIYSFTGINSSSNIGKNTFLTYVADGLGFLSLYSNGVLLEKISSNTEIIYNSFFRARTQAYLSGASHYYRIQSGAMTATQVLAEYNKLRTYIPEIETVQIGSKYIASSNFQAVATPAGNVIPEVQTAGAVEKYANSGASGMTDWVSTVIAGLADGWSISASLTPTIVTGNGFAGNAQRIEATTTSGGYLFTAVPFSIGKYYKITGKYRSNTNFRLTNAINTITIGINTSNCLPFSVIAKATVAGNLRFTFVGGAIGDYLELDEISCTELNWSNATEIYDAVYAATAGDASTKHYAAVKEAAMWCSYDNSTANQAIYGKLYNDYAVQFLKTDMATQSFGYHIPTEAEKTAILAAYTDANTLKKEGTNYWDDAQGTNTSGLTLLGTGCRMSDGSFASIKKVGGFATSDGNTFKQLGLPIRLIKD